MRKKYLLLLSLIPIACSAKVYLKYGKSWGRFGDNLLSYMHTKYVSYKTGIPVLYTPFIYSEQLKFSDFEIKSKDLIAKKIQVNEGLVSNNFTSLIEAKNSNPKGNIVFEIPYFPEDLYEYRTYKHINDQWIFFPVDWNDLKFKSILKDSIVPNQSLCLIQVPRDKISIAIHVRDGGGFDDAEAYLNNPLKFPPLEYYVKALEDILLLFKEDDDFYVYIFTDHQRPKELLHYFRDRFEVDPKPWTVLGGIFRYKSNYQVAT